MTTTLPVRSIPVLGILHYNRPDLLQRCIESIDYPVDTLVVIQNGPDSQMWSGLKTLEKFLLQCPNQDKRHVPHKQYPAGRVPRFAKMIKRVVHIRHPNSGCAGGWNEVIRLFPAPWWMIAGNDIKFSAGDLGKMTKFVEERIDGTKLEESNWQPAAMVYGNHGASWFAITAFGVQQVGLFDENLYPAYLEDCDISYRLKLVGASVFNVPTVRAIHGKYKLKGSCTIQSDPLLAVKNARTHGANFEYYRSKWGGINGQETYKTPFNIPKVPVSFWAFDPYFRAKQQWFPCHETIATLQRMKPKRKLQIKIFAFFYNEEFLIPFFLNHYSFVDCIHAFVSKSTDATRKLLEQDHRVIIEDFEFPAGMDDFLKRDKLNETIRKLDPDYDWYFILDADEFIWPENCAAQARNFRQIVPEFLMRIPLERNCLMARMWNVYRHRDDTDLDAGKEPVIFQRTHGVQDRGTGENALYQKPIVIRPNRGLQFEIGNHFLQPNSALRKANESFDGTHWANADPCFAKIRRCRDRRGRQSDINIRYDLGSQHHHITEQAVEKICEAHANDPQVFNPSTFQRPAKATNEQFIDLINKIHAGINPYAGYERISAEWPVYHWTEWGSDHVWLTELVEELRPRLIIEVGSFLGGSAITMGNRLKTLNLRNSAVLCIDTWLAEEILWSMPDHREKLKITYGTPCFYYTFLSNMVDRNLHDIVIPLRMPSCSASRYLKTFGIMANLVYIDGSHIEGDVIRDLEMYWDILKLGGVLLVDDYEPENPMFTGVVADVNRFAAIQHLKIKRLSNKVQLRKYS